MLREELVNAASQGYASPIGDVTWYYDPFTSACMYAAQRTGESAIIHFSKMRHIQILYLFTTIGLESITCVDEMVYARFKHSKKIDSV